MRSHKGAIPLYRSPLNLARTSPLWPGFDRHVDRGRDRDRFVERSMILVVLDEIDRLRSAGARKPEKHVDALKHGGVAAMTDGFDVDLDLLEAHVRVARPALHQQHAARGDARQERFGRRDLLTGATKVRRLVDDELV